MANQIVAFQDERHGLGAWVAEQVAAHMFRYGMWTDGEGQPVLRDDGRPDNSRTPPTPGAAYGANSNYQMRLSAAGSSLAVAEAPRQRTDDQLDFAYRTWTSPRTTAESTLSAVIGRQAQLAVVPLYDNDLSFNKETLAALVNFPQNEVLREYVAESNYVLAAPTDLIHEIEQSGYTDSFSTGQSTAFAWNRDKQLRYMRRVSTIYASADAMKHCQAALDGYRARGVDVQLIPDGVDTYREGLRLSTQMLDPGRRVETRYSATKHERRSYSRGENHQKPLIAVLLSHDRALSHGGYSYDSDYAILEAEMAGADRIRTSFIALRRGFQGLAGDTQDPVSYEVERIKRHFKDRPARGAANGPDQRALYPLAGDAPWPDQANQEKPAYVRALYRFNTVGPGVGDYSKVLHTLTSHGFSFRTTMLDNLPGQPMVVALDVPTDGSARLKPALRAIMKQAGARRLCDFAAIRPMVDEQARPKLALGGRKRIAAWGAVGVVLSLVGYFLWQA